MVKNSKFKLVLLVLLISGLALYFFSKHDAFLYQQPIGEVLKVKNHKPVATVDEFKNKDATINQDVTLKLLNGSNPGKIIKLKNTYAKSGAITQDLKAKQDVFLNRHQNGHQVYYQVSHFKRDTYLLMLGWLIVTLLIMTMGFHGLGTLSSVLINFILFILFVQVDVKLNFTHFFWLFAFSALLFTGISLLVVIGRNRQFVVTFSSVLIATSCALGIGALVLHFGGDDTIHYESLNFATQSPTQLFFSATVIGLLGAVMDAATDIVSTLFEIKRTEPSLLPPQIQKTGFELGRAIMGPLVNVLLMIFFAQTITMAILFFRTGNTIAYTFEWTMILGVIQTLISGIGIVLTIPLASFLSSYALKEVKA